jgi:hypothetical protein
MIFVPWNTTRVSTLWPRKSVEPPRCRAHGHLLVRTVLVECYRDGSTSRCTSEESGRLLSMHTGVMIIDGTHLISELSRRFSMSLRVRGVYTMILLLRPSMHIRTEPSLSASKSGTVSKDQFHTPSMLHDYSLTLQEREH